MAAAVMLGSCTVTVGVDRGVVRALHCDTSDLHVSLLRPRSWQRLHERASVHADMDLLAVPALFVHSADALSQSIEVLGLQLKVGVPQIAVEWKLEWHLTAVALAELCLGLSLKTAPAPAISRSNSLSRGDDVKAPARTTGPVFRGIDVEVEHVQATATLSPSSVLVVDIKLLQAAVDVNAKKGTAIRVSAPAASVLMNEHRIGVIGVLEVTNMAKSSEIQRHLSTFSDTSNVFYAPIDSGSKVFWFAPYCCCFRNHLLAGPSRQPPSRSASRLHSILATGLRM